MQDVEIWYLRPLTLIVIVRKSDTFLRPKSETKSRTSETTVRPGLSRDDQYPKAGKESSTSTEALREGLSRLFNDDTDPQRKKSTDLANALHNTSIQQRQSAETGDGNTAGSVQGLRSGAASIHSLPLKDVPARTSSLAPSRQASLQDFPSWRLPGPAAAARFVPPRGRAESPIKRSISKDAVSSDALRPSPSRTFIRSSPPLRLLEHSSITHRRLQLSSDLKAPLFVGGGSVEGDLKLSIDQCDYMKSRSKPLLISKLSVDIVGVEEISDGRK